MSKTKRKDLRLLLWLLVRTKTVYPQQSSAWGGKTRSHLIFIKIIEYYEPESKNSWQMQKWTKTNRTDKTWPCLTCLSACHHDLDRRKITGIPA